MMFCFVLLPLYKRCTRDAPHFLSTLRLLSYLRLRGRYLPAVIMKKKIVAAWNTKPAALNTGLTSESEQHLNQEGGAHVIVLGMEPFFKNQW